MKPRRCLITAGPTREFFDPVRFISNPSSGKMGYALAAAALARQWQVELVSGPVALTPPQGAKVDSVVTGEAMFASVQEKFPSCDCLIMCAAVCDMRPKQQQPHKVKKNELEWNVPFEPVVDILKSIAPSKRDNQLVIGFAAETHDVVAYARKKLLDKQLDAIVANQVGGPDSAFEADMTAVTVLGKDGSKTPYGPATKQSVATELIDHFARLLP